MLFQFQYSIKTALIVLTVVAIVLAWQLQRASWYQRRAKLKAELEAVGYSFFSAEEVNAEQPVLFTDYATENSWSKQWDSFWFGDDATDTYVLCGVGTYHFSRTELPDAKRSLGRLFPEIEMVIIMCHTDLSEFLINGATIPRLDSTRLELWQGFQKEFAELPNLRVFFCNVWGIDNSFVDALPQNNLLETVVNTPISLKPDQARLFLDKSPRLNWFHLNESAIDERVQEILNASYTEEGVDHPLHAAERPNEPHVNLYTCGGCSWLGD